MTDELPWIADPILQGGGECGELIRQADWHASPLGVPVDWSKELRTLVSVMLGSAQPILIVWGAERTTLYNDGYAAMCGNRHPAALGRSFQELWFDIWDTVEPILSSAYAGQGTSMDAIQFTMHRNGYPEETHFSFSYTPVRDESGAVLGMFCACAEITQAVLARRAQNQEQERLRRMFEWAPAGIAMLAGPDHRFTMTNRAYERLVGMTGLVGRTVLDAMPAVQAQGFVALLDQVYASGEAYVGSDVLFELPEGRDGAEPIYLDFVYQPVRDVQGQVDGIFVQATDVTGRSIASRHQAMLNSELSHRMKNQLAIVQAIVSQTLRNAPTLDDAQRSIRDRIVVLGRAHDILLGGEIGPTSVGAIVHSIVELHADGTAHRFEVDGPDVAVASRPGVSLSLILHELATNAIKHGSLSVPEGRVGIAWRVEPDGGDGRFVLDWRESGGPLVGLPLRNGAGTRLIGAGLAGTADSRVVVDYDPAGVRCNISAELVNFQAER